MMSGLPVACRMTWPEREAAGSERLRGSASSWQPEGDSSSGAALSLPLLHALAGKGGAICQMGQEVAVAFITKGRQRRSKSWRSRARRSLRRANRALF